MNISPEALSLPAFGIAADVNAKLAVSPSLVITAPPGAGKSTLLPLTMLDALPEPHGRILMLEPRRLAARQIAERMASLIGEPVGQTVGYRVRFECRVSAQTRIEVLTEGILSRMVIDDPTLDGVSVVIFDEFHERSIFADVALALTRDAQQILRPDLRIVIMSATIDASSICKALSAPLLESRGRMFPVDVRHSSDDADPLSVAEQVAHVIRQAHGQHEGDILAFLPGEAEIRKCQALLGSSLGGTRVFPLFGLLPPKEQRLAIAPSAPGERKVVLATPIAETSLTIEGVRVVVDSGLCRTMVFDPLSGLSHLETVRISLDMANQRTGRAGRVAPGVCYRLWTLATEHRMPECRTPEIEVADLAPMMLDVAAWGETSVEQMTWLSPPPKHHVQQAQDLLLMLNAVDDDGRITKHGRELSRLPCHPRIAQMLSEAQSSKSKALATDIAALLEEKDPFAKSDHGADINVRIAALREARAGNNGGKTWMRIARIAEQYRQIAGVQVDNSAPDVLMSGALIAAAYPERIASARPGRRGLFMLSCGDLAQLDKDDDLAAEEWIAVASLNAREGGGRIFLASPLAPSDLQHLLREKDNISWDNKRGVVVAQREYRIGRLVLGSRPISDGNRQLAARAICEAAQKYGTSMLDFSDSVLNLQRRVATVASWHPELNLPDLSTDSVLATAPDWLPMYLGRASSQAELKKIDLEAALWAMLSYEQQQAVDRLAPSHVTVPTGSRIRIEYRQGADAPILRVRLQECFGLTDTPMMDNGARPVLMELLSPGFKPVQLTQDLRSFWESTYFEVRKELKRRYPKHSWPDDPLLAEAVRGVKRK